MEKILIVDDEKLINDLIFMNLRLFGYTCFQAYDGGEAVKLADQIKPDLILLDEMLPVESGFDLLGRGAFKNVPVIFITARSSVSDRVHGLKSGADDYIVKPFEAAELLARVEAVLRRTHPAENTFNIGSTLISLDKRTASVEGVPVDLTSREFELLEVLIRNRNFALSREKLLDLAWGYDFYGDTRTVDVHIMKLRKKLKLEEHIKTVYKMGYRLEVN